MLQDEKDKLLTLFETEVQWCREVDARDAEGSPVHYDDTTAVSWDLVGGICHLFGWHRACDLFGQVARHLLGPQKPHFNRDAQMAAMAALQDFNDKPETTYDMFMDALKGLPVWQGKPAAT